MRAASAILTPRCGLPSSPSGRGSPRRASMRPVTTRSSQAVPTRSFTFRAFVRSPDRPDHGAGAHSPKMAPEREKATPRRRAAHSTDLQTRNRRPFLTARLPGRLTQQIRMGHLRSYLGGTNLPAAARSSPPLLEPGRSSNKGFAHDDLNPERGPGQARQRQSWHCERDQALWNQLARTAKTPPLSDESVRFTPARPPAQDNSARRHIARNASAVIAK